jgi:hypothetical protein
MSVSINGDNGLTFNDGSTQTTSPFTGGFGFRNRVINGDMRIDQRNAGASVSPAGSAVYIADRWKIQSVSGTAQRISSTLSGFANSFKYTSSGSNAYMQMGQQIEFVNCSDLQNQTVVISFRAKANNANSGSTALTVRTRTAAAVDGAALFAGSNSDTSVTLTTSDAIYTVTRTFPSTFGALSLEFVLGSHVSSDGIEITGIQLEKGSTATSFDYRDYGRELALCQRYYEKSFPIGTAPANGVYSMGYLGYVCFADQWVFAVPTILFKVTKRSAPTMSYFGTSTNTWQLNDNSNVWQNQAAIGQFQATIGIYETGFNVGVHNNGNSGYAIGSARMIRGDWTASSDF